ncbi:hypothetical protein [Hymenobacter cellulosilyticus]|uniref:DUF4412 domain-containing protein n=1 Tax=Hymenobacter cellulosilyticus TaxID=2932248 RepID=A0A8T9QB96_9BACT|nr:hypothetical protein [Hymenobacter cellulosilyticus]UOQ74455.1 hypothetical protein MUN79_11585 [Hymenobacter cellulosilyticus]
MKAVFTLLLGVLATFSALAQNFEGRILYTNTYKSKLPDLTDQQWAAAMGVNQEYYVKGGSYKTIMNGMLMQWQLFPGSDGKLYAKMSNSEAAIWVDTSTNPDEVLKAEVKKNAATILGYKCDELTLTCKSGVQKYYFSSKQAIDPKLYENHKYGNWYDILKNTKALPLKLVVDTPQFSMESVATEVKAMKLEDSFFALPAGIPTVKSPN